MSFDYTTLITDRTQADVARVKALAAKGWAGMTEEEQAEWLTDLKGAYNASDMNRVGACLEDLVSRLHALGYSVPSYKRVEIERGGAPTSRLPEGYTEVEYIQSSGAQWINTGVTAPDGFYVKMDFTLVSGVESNQTLIGTEISASPWECNWVRMAVGVWSLGVYSANNYSQTPVAGERYFIEASTVKGASYLTVNETRVLTLTDSNARASTILYLFANNKAGTAADFSIIKCYSCQITVENELVRDFVPCIDPSGAAGLYDLVDGQYYGNAGTGSFTAGDTVESSASEADPAIDPDFDPDTWYETDAPTESEAAAYLDNVAAVRAVMPVMDTTPETPADMRNLTYQEANDMEKILVDVDHLITCLRQSLYYSGEICAGEG